MSASCPPTLVPGGAPCAITLSNPSGWSGSENLGVMYTDAAGYQSQTLVQVNP